MKPKPELPSPDLSEVVEMVVSRVISGQPVEVDSLCAHNPHLREQLEAVLPAVQAMAEFGNGSAVKKKTLAAPAGSDSLPSSQPKELGDFRILREIGRGGMGVVYEAEQLSLRRRVALKVLPFASVLDPRHLQRFKNEAQAAAALKHPHIVSVHAVGCERGVHFYAMELVEGQSLAEVIRELRAKDRVPSGNIHSDSHRTPCGDSRRGASCHNQHPQLSPIADVVQTANGDTQPIVALSAARSTDRRDFYRSVAQLGIQAAEALQYAHECGIVHRDIKPSNLLVDRHAKLWVTDFGLAMTQAGDGLTLTGDLIGTVRYMSPEQAAGNWALVDHRADVYSLGASLYELLTLRPAFEGQDRQALLRRIDEKDAPPPRGIDAAIPRDLETIVMKAMAKDSHERYATAGELAEDLQRFLDLKPIRARRSTRAQKLLRWAKRNPKLAAASLIASILTILLAVGGPIAAIRQSQLVRDVKGLVETERSEREEKSKLAQQLERQLYDAQMAKAHTAVLHHEFDGAARILKEYVPQPGAEDHHRSFEWYHLWWSCQRVLNVPTIELEQNDTSLHCCGYAPNGRYLAVADWHGDVAVYDVESRNLIWDSGRVKPSLGHFRTRQPTEIHKEVVNDLVFTPDSQVLVTASRDRSLKVWHVATGKLLLTKAFVEPDLEVSSLAISPDGQTLATGFGRPDQTSREPIHISVWKLERTGQSVTLQPHLELPGLTGLVHSLAISQDGRFLAACCRDDRIRIFTLADGQPLPSLEGHSGTIRAVAFSPADGNLLASASYGESVTEHGGGEIKLWDIGDSAKIATLLRNAWTRCLAFSPDGSRLVAGDHEGLIRIWDVESRELRREFPAHGKQVNDIAFSPSGESMLTVSHDRTAKIWSQSHYVDEPTRISGHGASILRLAVSHDSSLLLSAGSDGIAKLWHPRTGREIAKTECRVEHLFAADFSPNDRYVAIGGGHWRQDDQPLELFLWDVRTHKRKVLFSDLTSDANGTVILGVAFSPAGDRVAAGIGPDIHIWKVPDGQPLNVIHGNNGYINELAWSKQTNRIATLNMNPVYELRLWNGETGEKIAALPIPDGVSLLFRVAFSPDGQTLAVGTQDGEILLYDAVKCRFLRRLTGHTDWVYDVAFSPDGRRLASASQDRTVKLWNLETDTALLTFREPRNPIWAVRFSPDGRALFAATDHAEDSVIHVWRAVTPEETQLEVDSKRD